MPVNSCSEREESMRAHRRSGQKVQVEPLEHRSLFSSSSLPNSLDLKLADQLGGTPIAKPLYELAQPLVEGSATPVGLTPAQIRGAYGLGQFGASPITFGGVQGDGSGQTVAIVVAFHYPTALADLNQ